MSEQPYPGKSDFLYGGNLLWIKFEIYHKNGTTPILDDWYPDDKSKINVQLVFSR